MSPPTLDDAPVLRPDIALVGSFRGQFGESAVWCPESGAVWWVDMHGHALISTKPDGTTRLWKTPPPALPWIRAVVLRADGGLVVALGDQLASFDPMTGHYADIAIDWLLPAGHLFNDASVDCAGRLIIGTMLPGLGNDGRAAIIAVERGGRSRLLVDGLNTTNGLAFSPDGSTLYYSDSFADVRQVWAADYDSDRGTMGTPRRFIDFAALPGKPDGAAVDSEGCYWSAAMASPYLHRFTADGSLERSILLPTGTPSRPAFGGSLLDRLFVTTGGLKAGEVDDGWKGGLLGLAAPMPGMEAWRCHL